MSDMFKLPGSSYKELQKIIQAYGTSKKGSVVQLDELSQSSGAPSTVISRNNGFLVQIKLVTEGKKKSATDLGRKLASAYVNDIEEKVCRIWKEIIDANDFLSRMVNTVRIKGEMDKAEYVNHIVYSSGVTSSNNSRSGAGTIIEIFKLVGMVEERDGKFTVAKVKPNEEVQTIDSGQVNSTTEQVNSHPIMNKNNASNLKNEDVNKEEYITQPYVCESGKTAKIVIPIDATEDDVYALRDLLEIIMKRKFKMRIDV